MMKNQQSPNSSHVIRGLAIFLFVIVWCELILQIGIFYWSGKNFSSFQPYVWSPYGLVRNNPKFTSPAFQINSNGFREIREYMQEKPPNTVRVMLLGGSVLYAGLGGIPIPGITRVSSAHTISQYLTRELQNAPSCKGKNIEVINAAVNFNRISEIVPAYLNDYINWDADLVIVGSSLNNFAGGVTPSSKLLGLHIWEAEFQRLVNDSGMASSIEVMTRRLSDNLASAGVARKFVTKMSSFIEPKGTLPPNQSVEETSTDRLNKKNLERFSSYASAMLAAANFRNQKISFFWEHDLWNSVSFKPFSKDEVVLGRLNPPMENPFYWQQLNWLKDFAKAKDAGFIDPQSEMTNYKPTIFIDYGHYTAEGNEFMAKVMAARIVGKDSCLTYDKNKLQSK
jgi:hypothetical protein